MVFSGEVIKDASMDPYFKIEFRYESESAVIRKGYAEVVRKAPRPVVTFDAAIDSRLGNEDRAKLELELLNIVIDYILSNGVRRSWKGNIILRTA